MLTFFVFGMGWEGNAATTKKMFFDHFTVDNGISSNQVASVKQDLHGHIWMATDCGLNRFDGAIFKSYGKMEYPGIYRQDFEQLFLLPNGDAVMGGYTGLLLYYDAQKDLFHDAAPSDFAKTYLKTTNGFADGLSKDVFAFTSTGFYKLDSSKQVFVNDFPAYEKLQNDIKEMYVDVRGRYWLITTRELMVCSEQGDVESVFNLATDDASSIISCFLPLSDSLVAAYGVADRVHFFSIDGKGKVRLERVVQLPFKNVREMVCAPSGEWWIVTDGYGLWHTNATPHSSSDFERILLYGVDESAFNKLYGVLVDRNGDVWVGSQNSGLWRCRRGSSNGVFSSAELGMTCVATDFAMAGKQIYVASDGVGVYTFNRKSNEMTLFGEAQGLTNKNVTALYSDSNNRLWVSTWGGGLFVAEHADNPDNIHFKPVSFKGIDMPRTNFFKAIEMKNGDFWVCSGGDGVYQCINGVWSVKSLKHENFGPDPDQWPYFVLPVGSSDQWIFTSSTAWINHNGQVRPVDAHYQGSSHDLIGVKDACYVPGHGVLLATNQGLLLFSTDGQSFQALDYCPQVDYSSICVGNDGDVWASGACGIIGIDMNKRTVYNYPMDFSAKGQNFFFKRSRFVDDTGRIYFGNREGFFSFDPSRLPEDKGPDFLSFSNFYVNGTKLNINADGLLCLNEDEKGEWNVAHRKGSITLRHGETNLNIGLDMVDFHECRCHCYYRLKGLNEEWTQVGHSQNISFSYIPSGDYTLEVKALRTDNSTQDALLSLSLSVLPPWWATWWFRCLVAAFLAFLVFLKIKSLQKESAVLQQKVEERTMELVNKNQLIEKRNAELNKVLGYKDRLIAVVAHDLKNPMFAIVGALEGLKRKDETLRPEERQVIVGNVLNSARTLQNEMSKLLAWATSSQDDIEYRPANTDLAKILADDIALVSPSAEAKGVKLFSEINIRNYAFVDSRMVSTAVRNVLSNSVKFTLPGKNVYLNAWQDGKEIIVKINDEGVGMSAEKLAELQKSGRHASTDGTSGEKGTGLGVNIVRDYVLQNNGRMEISSKEGEGTTTLIILPAADEKILTSDLAPDVVPTFEMDAELMEGNTILVVDDDELICENIKNMLDNYVKVIVAHNGKEAIQMASENDVDVVVSDVEMPVMNGIQMSIDLSKNAQLNHIPILFLSARSTESDRLMGLLTGAIDYIPKPFSRNELLIKINNILSLRQKQQQRLLKDHMSVDVVKLADDEQPMPDVDDKPGNEEMNNAGVANEKPKEEVINPWLQQMLDVVEKNYTDSEYSVERLADDMCMTKITLYRRLKSLTGQSPVEVINDYRLNKAMALLKEGKMPVGDVAYKVGFSDPAYFTRRFRSAFGCPPSAVKTDD